MEQELDGNPYNFDKYQDIKDYNKEVVCKYCQSKEVLITPLNVSFRYGGSCLEDLPPKGIEQMAKVQHLVDAILSANQHSKCSLTIECEECKHNFSLHQPIDPVVLRRWIKNKAKKGYSQYERIMEL